MFDQIGKLLYRFRSDLHGLDEDLLSLQEEVNRLKLLIHLIQGVERKPFLQAMQAGSEGELWQIVVASVNDCKTTLGKLDSKLKGVHHRKHFSRRSFFLQPTKVVKSNLSMKDIAEFKQRILSHNSAMQSALALINLSV